MHEETNAGNNVQAIERAFQVLEAVAAGSSLSLNDLYSDLKINKASLLRILASLIKSGYIAKDDNEKYFLTMKAFSIGINAIKNLDYLKIVREVLHELSSTTGTIAQFSIDDGNELLCLESVDSKSNGFSIYTRIGSRTPLYATSAGKALLSTYSNDEIALRWSNFNVHSYTENTITSLNDLMNEIAAIRRKNYAVDHEETERNLFCVGSVVLNYSNKPVGAISLSLDRLDDETEAYLSGVLLDKVHSLSKLFGYIY